MDPTAPGESAWELELSKRLSAALEAQEVAYSDRDASIRVCCVIEGAVCSIVTCILVFVNFSKRALLTIRNNDLPSVEATVYHVTLMRPGRNSRRPAPSLMMRPRPGWRLVGTNIWGQQMICTNITYL